MVSMRQLSELAGVSVATVSRCLNDHPSISIETKEHVRKLAMEHGYSEHGKNKKVLMSPKRKAIGIMLTNEPFFDNIFINYTLSILTDKILRKNYYLFTLLDNDSDSDNERIERLRSVVQFGFLKGFIILNRRYNDAIHTYLDEIGIPHIYMLHYSRMSIETTDIVDSDNFYGGYLGTRHLLTHGHRRIATITCPWREFEDRTQGYCNALDEYGIKPDDRLVLSTECTYNGGYKAVLDNMHIISQCTAIYAQADLIAYGAINALKDHGVQVPRDMSVIGSDGYELSDMYNPKLDSVAHPIFELCDIAVERLIELQSLTKKQTPRQQILRPHIIERGSVLHVGHSDRAKKPQNVVKWR